MGVLDDSYQTVSTSEEGSPYSYSDSSTNYDDEEATTVDPNNQQKSAPMKAGHRMVEIAKLTYRDFIIGIFKSKDSTHRFFFEPIVQLDPTSIITTQSNRLPNTHQDAVRFRILDRLRSLPSLKTWKFMKTMST